MNKEEAVKKINESDNDDFQVYTKVEHETFLNNYRETEVSKGIKEDIFKVHQRYEEDIAEITGVKKDTNEKGYEFLKRQLNSMKSDIQEKAAKIETLEKSGGDESEAMKLLRDENKALMKKHQSVLDEYKGKLESKDKEFHQVKVFNELDSSLVGIKFKDAAIIPEDLRNMAINTAKADIAKSASFIDGKLVFLNAEGEPMRDENLAIRTAADLMREKLKPIIDEGRKAPGVDIKDPVIEKDKDGKIDVKLNIPDTVKTNADLTEHLMKSGLKRGTDEYHAAYKKYSEGLTKV